MLLGDNFTRPSPLEVKTAEELLSLIPGAEMVKFAKNGSDVTTAGGQAGARLYGERSSRRVC